MAGLTESIADFIVETRSDDAPAGADARGTKVLADTFAVMLAGVGSEAFEPLQRYIQAARSVGTSPVPGTSMTAAPKSSSSALRPGSDTAA